MKAHCKNIDLMYVLALGRGGASLALDELLIDTINASTHNGKLLNADKYRTGPVPNMAAVFLYICVSKYDVNIDINSDFD